MKKISVNRSIIFQKIDDKLVGFDIDRSALYTFNETAEFIYKKLKTGNTAEKVAKQLAKKYAIEEKAALKDVAALVNDLKKNKILL